MRKLVLLLSALALVLQLGVPVALATPTGCAGSRSFNFVGGYKTTTAYGAEAEIETQSLDLCANSYESLWAMSAGPGSYDYVQVGWIQLAGSSPQWFWEASSTGTAYWDQLIWGSASGFNVFRVNYVDMGNPKNLDYWDFLINGNSVHSLPWSDLSWSPSEIQVFAEPHDTGDQVAGTKLNPVSFSAVKVKTSKSGTFTSTSLAKYISPGVSSHTGTNMTDPDSAWEIWDTRY